MGAPGLTSPIRAQGFKNLQLNAGVFVTNLDMSKINSAQTLRAVIAARIEAGTTLGMTSSGGTFTFTRETRLPEADGRRYLHKGAQFVDSMDGYISGTLVEITPENWQAVIGTTEPLTGNTAGKAAYNIKTMLGDGAYLNNIVWVGDTADGKFIAIEVENALNTADIGFTFQDKNEGKLPFELHAHQGGVLVYDQAPVKMYVFREVVTRANIAGVNTITGGEDWRVFPLPNGNVFPAGIYDVKLALTELSDGNATSMMVGLLRNREQVGAGSVFFTSVNASTYKTATINTSGKEFDAVGVKFSATDKTAKIRFGNPSITLNT